TQQPNNTVIVYPNDQQYIWAVTQFDAAFKVVLRGNQPSNRLTIVEDLLYNGTASRCQIHTREDVTMLVLNGSLQFYLNGYQFCAPAGTTIHIPLNATQSQRNLGSKPVHIQILLTPSGLENYLDQIAVILAQQPLNETAANESALANGLLFFPEVEWQDLHCAFNVGTLFFLSFPITFSVLLHYKMLFICGFALLV
ncbi:unnamed protein product, partial [Rotaria socialis]